MPQRRENIRILATEATRTAINADAFIQAIETSLGEPWKVTLLKKEDEGRVGALGVVSSVGGSSGLEGLVMDLGGMFAFRFGALYSALGLIPNVTRWIDTNHLDDRTPRARNADLRDSVHVLPLWSGCHDTFAV